MIRLKNSKVSPAERRQIEIDAMIDQMLESGQSVDDATMKMISNHHWKLLRACGLYRAKTGWRLPKID